LPQPSQSDSHSALLISSSFLVFQNGASMAQDMKRGDGPVKARVGVMSPYCRRRAVAAAPGLGPYSMENGTIAVLGGLRRDGTFRSQETD
jgi:hypothetical protein